MAERTTGPEQTTRHEPTRTADRARDAAAREAWAEAYDAFHTLGPEGLDGFGAPLPFLPERWHGRPLCGVW
ncbi:hypothetical protein [Streptomyces sp. NPDC059881]|uniref:hypothetical protein n=1 Tax=Streptomyces sp. NPDC059881 TaxID=3346986 RepID=UPI00365DB7C8